MSQEDSLEGKPNPEPKDPKVNVEWTPAVSGSKALAVILKPENKRLFCALQAYVNRA